MNCEGCVSCWNRAAGIDSGSGARSRAGSMASIVLRRWRTVRAWWVSPCRRFGGVVRRHAGVAEVFGVCGEGARGERGRTTLGQISGVSESIGEGGGAVGSRRHD